MSHQPDRPTEPVRPKAPEPKRPYHVAIAVGLSTGVYAISLLATTAWQIAADRALIAERRPMADAISLLADHHARLESNVVDARDLYAERVTGFDGLSDRLATLDDRLAGMNKTVAAIEKLSASLSVNLSLPSVPVARSQGSPPEAAGTTNNGGGASTVKPPPAPPPAPAAPPPPPTSAQTGASG